MTLHRRLICRVPAGRIEFVSNRAQISREKRKHVREVARARGAEAALKHDRWTRRAGPRRRGDVEPHGAAVHLNGDVLRLSGRTDEQQRKKERPGVHSGPLPAAQCRVPAEDEFRPVRLYHTDPPKIRGQARKFLK